MASQITSHSTLCMYRQADIKLNTKAPHDRSYMMEIHRSLVDSHEKGTIMRKVFACHDAIMIFECP